MLGARCGRGLLLDQVAHFLSFVKSGCDAADFIFDIPMPDCREMPDDPPVNVRRASRCG
jgi:hypothetical protein